MSCRLTALIWWTLVDCSHVMLFENALTCKIADGGSPSHFRLMFLSKKSNNVRGRKGNARINVRGGSDLVEQPCVLLLGTALPCVPLCPPLCAPVGGRLWGLLLSSCVLSSCALPSCVLSSRVQTKNNSENLCKHAQPSVIQQETARAHAPICELICLFVVICRYRWPYGANHKLDKLIWSCI